jgi:hypothetical protein
MRTERIDDPASWRAWDGKAFSVPFSNPYTESVADPSRHVCAPVGRGRLMTPLGGIVRHEPSGAYIVVMAGLRQDQSGVYVAASWDLVEWSAPHLLWQVPTEMPKDGCPAATYGYPSLIDPASADRNFATVGDTADLYIVAHNIKECRVGPDRDLLRRALVQLHETAIVAGSGKFDLLCGKLAVIVAQRRRCGLHAQRLGRADGEADGEATRFVDALRGNGDLRGIGGTLQEYGVPVARQGGAIGGDDMPAGLEGEVADHIVAQPADHIDHVDGLAEATD